jgi:hypothetical protein
MTRGIERFQKILGDFQNLSVWAVGTGVVPFVAAFTSIAPPWPKGIAAITAIGQLSVLIVVHQLLNRSPRRVINRVVVSSFCAVLVTSLIYVAILLNFTYVLNGSDARYPKGVICTHVAKAVYPDKCPFLGIDELKEAEYQADRLWTDISINAVSLSLLCVWLLAFMALATLVGSFVVYQQRGRAAAHTPA